MNREILVASFALMLLAAIVLGQTPAPTVDENLKFDVASVKRNTSGDTAIGGGGLLPGGEFSINNAPLSIIFRMAYPYDSPSQVVGAPDWFNTDRFAIRAKAPEGTALAPRTFGQPGPLQMMLRNLLAERFKLTVHTEKREQTVLKLVVARADKRLGTDLQPVSPECAAWFAAVASLPPGERRSPLKQPGDNLACGSIRFGVGTDESGGTTMGMLASYLSGQVGALIVDATDLPGRYTFKLQWTPDRIPDGAIQPPAAPPVDTNGVSLATALQEQLGLKLESTKAPVDVLVIDHVEHPTED